MPTVRRDGVRGLLCDERPHTVAKVQILAKSQCPLLAHIDLRVGMPGACRSTLRVFSGKVSMMAQQTLDAAAHVVQLALTPIFLLAGLAQLLNVFTARLGRIADRAYRLAHEPTSSRIELQRLTLRSRILDGAVLMATFSGGLTCGAALMMFLGALRDAGAGVVLFLFFGGALLCAIVALAAFAAETILSGRSIREKVTGRNRRA